MKAAGRSRSIWRCCLAFSVLLLLYATGSQALTVPEQCKGKTVKCDESQCVSYAVYCPITMVYNDKGEWIGTEGNCGKNSSCHYRCACDGYFFETDE